MADAAPNAPIQPEFGPSGAPLEPPAGDDTPQQDSDLIMDTFFGEDKPNSSSDQTDGSKDDDGQGKGSLARPETAPAANGEGDDSQSGSPSTQQGGEQGPVGDKGTQTPGRQDPTPPVPESSTEPTAEQRLKDAELAALREQNAALLARLSSPETTKPSAEPGTAPQPEAGKEEIQPLAVPDNVFAAMFGEDPAVAKGAVNLLLTSVAHIAVKRALEAVPALIDARLGAVTEQTKAQQKVNEMEEAYFSAYPQHKNKLFMPLIQQVTEEKYKLFPHAEWDDNMIASVGATVTERLKALNIDPSVNAAPVPDGKDEPKPKPKPKPKPDPMLDTSTRGGEPSEAGDFIAATFG
jgi:hypothetical protein